MHRLPRRSPVALLLLGAPVMLLTLAAAPPPARAQEVEGSEHPTEQLVNELFVGEKVYVQEKGEWVLVLSPSFAKASDAKEVEFEAEVKYGLTDQLQLSAEVPYTHVDPDGGSSHHGIGDLTLAVNYNFIQNERYALAVRTEFTLPTGDDDRDLGGGQFAVTPYLLGAVRIGKGDIYAGIGETFGEDDDEFTYTLAGAYPFTDQFVGVLELTGFNGGGEDSLYFAPGLYWLPRKNIQVGVGVPIGLTDDSDDYQIVGHFVYEF